MIRLTLQGWRSLRAYYNLHRQAYWLRMLADTSRRFFLNGLMSGPHTGRIYRRRGKIHQASAPGQWPASDTGRLVSSLRIQHSTWEARIGTNTHYSGYLRNGTRRMARRKMSDNALREGRAATIGLVKGIIRWRQ